MPRIALRLVALLFLTPAFPPGASAAAEQAGTDDVTACVQRNLPQPDSIRAIRFTSRDRVGAKTITVVKMFGHRGDDGRRQLFVRFLEPEDIHGTALLFLEREGGNEVYFASTELDEPRKITGNGLSANLFGTDISYEDFERLEAMHPEERSRRLPDEAIRDRPVYVIETQPENSAYERIVSYIDQESCLPLLMKFYEGGGQLRKELTTNPRANLKHGSVWVPHMALMRDVRDLTTTQLMVDSHEQDVLLPAGIFSVEALQESIRAEAP
jgi:hypothetical protein